MVIAEVTERSATVEVVEFDCIGKKRIVRHIIVADRSFFFNYN